MSVLRRPSKASVNGCVSACCDVTEPLHATDTADSSLCLGCSGPCAGAEGRTGPLRLSGTAGLLDGRASFRAPDFQLFFQSEVHWGIPDPHNDYAHQPMVTRSSAASRAATASSMLPGVNDRRVINGMSRASEHPGVICPRLLVRIRDQPHSTRSEAGADRIVRGQLNARQAGISQTANCASAAIPAHAAAIALYRACNPTI